MSMERYSRVKQIFHELVDVPDAERQARLDAICSGDPDLRRELAGLLQHHDQEAAQREAVSSAPERFLRKHARTRVESTAAQSLVIDRKEQPRAAWRGWLQRLAWALLAALAIGIVGWLTDQQVRSRLQSNASDQLEMQLTWISDALDRWAEQRKETVSSWARSPEVEEATKTLLAAVQRSVNPRQALLNSPARQELDQALRQLAGTSGLEWSGRLTPVDPYAASADVKYVLYRMDGMQLASWDPDGRDVGFEALPAQVAEIQRVLETGPFLHLPEWLEPFPGFEPRDKDLEQPGMWISVPVQAGDQRAVLLVRGIGLYDDLQQILAESTVGGLRVFMFDDRGVMLHEPVEGNDWKNTVLAVDSHGGSAVGQLKLRTPPEPILGNRQRDWAPERWPLHPLVEQVRPSNVAVDVRGHRDYLGRAVIGAARWSAENGWGLLIERDAAEAYAPLASVRRAFLALLGAVGIGSGLAAWQAFRWGKATASQRESHERRVGPYELIGILGSGGMGTVFRARHRLLKRLTAVKVLNPGSFRPDALPRFEREVHIAARLRCPHTVSIYDYGFGPEGQPYFAMELLEGLTIDVVVSRTGPMPPARVIHLLLQLLESLAEAHSLGLVHRDIKPQNLMLTRRGGIDDWLVVFDFGLAKPLQPDPQLFETRERIWAGTPGYMAPERIMSPGKCDTRSDLYAVGAVGFFMLCGHDPFRGIDPQQLLETIVSAPVPQLDTPIRQATPPRLVALIEACLAKDPEQRPKSAEELIDDLSGLEPAYPWTRQQARAAWIRLLEAGPPFADQSGETARGEGRTGKGL